MVGKLCSDNPTYRSNPEQHEPASWTKSTLPRARRQRIDASADVIDRSARWALAETNRIDPVKSGRFLNALGSDDTSE
jgi:hypothetical protein